MILFVKHDANRSGRRERLFHKEVCVFAPLDNVNALTTKLAHDNGNAHTALSNERSHRIHVRVRREYGNFSTAPRLARNCLYFNRSARQLWSLLLKEFHYEFRVRARQTQVHTAETLVDRVQVRTYALAHTVALAWNLLFVGNDTSGAA